MSDALKADLEAGYGFDDDAIILGRGLVPTLDDTVNEVYVQAPLAMLNKHGLIAGATGTGKTKTLQVFAEQLSRAGVPVFLADLKGDLTGLAVASEGHPKIDERMDGMEIPWTPETFPIELLSITGEVGTPLRVPVSEFGPLLLAKVMDCSDTQESVLQVLFKFADEAGLPLLDLVDLVEVIKHLTSDEGKAVQKEYGGMSTATLNVLLRKAMELEVQGAEQFFGEPAFDVADLKRTRDGKGVITVMNLTDMQTQPKIFSTFMMWLLAELYETSPEVGDPDKPELVFFFDEAHLLFDGATSSLTEAVELTVRMIRSKGIGVFFVTQNPKDVPEDVLAQLGNRVQHALRAFTPQDQKALKATAATFPISDHYDVRETLTQLGIGEALVTVLSPKGAPTPTVATRLVAPVSTMDAVDADVVQQLIEAGDLRDKYREEVDRESAAELLGARMEERAVEEAKAAEVEAARQAAEDKARAERSSSSASRSGSRPGTGRRVGGGGSRSSSAAWGVAEDLAAGIAPHGKKGLARKGFKLIRGVLGNIGR